MRSTFLIRNLKFYAPLSGVVLSSTAMANSQPIDSIPLKEQERPHDGLHASMSCLAYANPAYVSESMNTNNRLPRFFKSFQSGLTPEEQSYADELKKRGWRVADFKEENGYAGIAFEHTQYRQLVIAHRGTRPTLSGIPQDGYTDLKLLQKELVEDHASAMVFSLTLYDKYAEPAKHWNKIGLVGHSLGGFLAQSALYAIHRFRLTEKGPHVYAVTLDNPGTAEFLDDLQPSIKGSKAVELKKLDITNYLSAAVNVVNASSRQLGTVYAIYDPQFPALTHNPLGYLLKSHDKNRLTACFDITTGEARAGCRLIRMESWPSIRYGDSAATTSGVGLVTGEILNNTKLYQQASQSISSAMTAVMRVIPGLNTIANQAYLFYNLGRTVHQFSETPINDGAYQAFRDMQQATALLGDELQKKPDEFIVTDVTTTEKTHKTNTQLFCQGLRSKWEKATLLNTPHDMALRHFPLKLSIFLKHFYQQVIETGLYQQADFVSRFPAFMNNQWLFEYGMDTSYQYISVSAHQEDAKFFRANLEQAATSWPGAYFAKNYFLIQMGRPLSSDLEAVKAKVEACVAHHLRLLKALRALQTQSRLYLFGKAPDSELKEHHERDEELGVLRGALQTQRQELAQHALHHPEQQEMVPELLAQFDYQDELLMLAKQLNVALLHLKEKEPVKVMEHVKLALQSLQPKTFLYQRIKADKRERMKLEELYACCYNLMGKAYRQQWDSKNQTSTQSVVMAYKKALEFIPDDYPTLSSLAAFYDDLKEYDTAKIYHDKALQTVDASKDHVIEQERKAVTNSNYAWNLYQRAQLSSVPKEKSRLLRQAQERLCYSLNILPNAGTHLYAAKVELAFAEEENKGQQAQQLKNFALEHLVIGLLIEPDNTKLLVERAELYQELQDDEKAEKDAQRAMMLLENKKGLSEQQAYYARAEQVVDSVEQRRRQKPVLSKL